VSGVRGQAAASLGTTTTHRTNISRDQAPHQAPSTRHQIVPTRSQQLGLVILVTVIVIIVLVRLW